MHHGHDIDSQQHHQQYVKMSLDLHNVTTGVGN